MRTTLAFLTALLLTVSVAADDFVVDFDLHFDFSKITTFAIRRASVTSARDELSNSIVAQNLSEVVRTAFVARGLREVGATPDVYVDVSVDGEDYVIGRGGEPHRVESEGRRGRRGGATDPTGPPPDFTQAALVIDLLVPQRRRSELAAGASEPEGELLIWRAVYRGSERTVSRLVATLPNITRTMLGEYPPKRKR